MISRDEIFPIGIGTWKIDCDNIEHDLKALAHSIELGQNYLSLYMLYNDGEVVRQMRKLINLIGRNKLFINASLEPTIKEIADIERQLDQYLSILGIKYVDSLQIHSPLFTDIPLELVYKEIKRLIGVGKVRYAGISNANLEQLIKANDVVQVKFFEGVYNLECKIYEDLGVLSYCKEHDIQFVCYQPLRRNRTASRKYPLLTELSEKYHKTPNQIILNWIIKEKGIFPLVKSTNIDRINENFASTIFDMSQEDYSKLNSFRSQDFDKVVIDWNGTGGITIDQLANQF